MKKLPKIFQNEFAKTINNNKKICYLKEVDSTNINNLSSKIEEDSNHFLEDEPSINRVLNQIFSGIGYSYNIPVTIKTKNKTYHTSLITRTNYHIITLDNEVIPISEIINISIDSSSN